MVKQAREMHSKTAFSNDCNQTYTLFKLTAGFFSSVTVFYFPVIEYGATCALKSAGKFKTSSQNISEENTKCTRPRIALKMYEIGFQLFKTVCGALTVVFPSHYSKHKQISPF